MNLKNIIGNEEMINWEIVPFEGIGKFKLYSSVSDIKKILDEEKISYFQEIQEHKNCTNPEPWVLITVKDMINFWFVKDKLFEIWIEKKFTGSLSNGLKFGMPIEKACKIDSELTFDDWDEIWKSPLGYWIEDNIDTKTVAKIAVFIREILDDDLFYSYEWC